MMAKKEYVFRKGAQVPRKIEAKTVYLEIEKIRRREAVTPKAVVRAAEPEDAPLHPAFDWDDSSAAQKYREAQARNIIRAVHVVVDKSEPRPVYIHIRRDDEERGREGFYEATTVVVGRPDLFMVALEELQRHLNAAARAVRHLEEAAAGTEDRDRLARLALAVKAFESASAAVAALQ